MINNRPDVNIVNKITETERRIQNWIDSGKLKKFKLIADRYHQEIEDLLEEYREISRIAGWLSFFQRMNADLETKCEVSISLNRFFRKNGFSSDVQFVSNEDINIGEWNGKQIQPHTDLNQTNDEVTERIKGVFRYILSMNGYELNQIVKKSDYKTTLKEVCGAFANSEDPIDFTLFHALCSEIPVDFYEILKENFDPKSLFEYSKKIKDLSEQKYDERRIGLFDKFRMAEMWLFDPIEDLLNSISGKTNLCAILCWEAKEKNKVYDLAGLSKRKLFESKIGEEIAKDPQFWRYVFFSLGSKDQIIPLVHQAIKSPRKFGKGLGGIYSVIRKVICKTILESEKCVPSMVEEDIESLSSYMSLCGQNGTKKQNDLCWQIFDKYILSDLDKYFAFVLEQEKTKEEQEEFERKELLWKPFKSESQNTEMEVPELKKESPSLWFAWEPGDPKQDVQFISDRINDADISTFLLANGIPCSIKIASISSALRYYYDLPETIREIMPKEIIGYERWDKIKRGKMRFYLRREPNKIIFRIFDRKDWKKTEYAK